MMVELMKLLIRQMRRLKLLINLLRVPEMIHQCCLWWILILVRPLMRPLIHQRTLPRLSLMMQTVSRPRLIQQWLCRCHKSLFLRHSC